MTLPPKNPSPTSGRSLQPLPPGSVRIGGEIGRRIELTIAGNLLKLDVHKDFLAPLAKKPGDYVGVGLLLKAASHFAAAGHADAAALRDRVAQALVRAQEPDGYIGYKTPGHKLWDLFDGDEVAQIILGLATHYDLTGSQPSLAAARKLARYVIREFRKNPEKASPARREGLDDMLTWISLEWAMIRLHEITGDGGLLDFCVLTRRLPAWNPPIVLGRWGRVEGHVYGYLVRCLAQLRLHRLRPQAALLRPTRRALEFMIRGNGQLITGAVGDSECWHDSQDGGWSLGETCASAYLLTLLDELLQQEQKSFYGDLMERIVYNTLFAAQSPDGRRLRYYTAIDGPRSYWKNDVYCCPNNFRRILSELPGLIVCRRGRGLAFNLYSACTLETRAAGTVPLAVQVETDYPASGTVDIRLDPARPATFPIWLRIPRWCARAAVSVNGRPIKKAAAAGAFLTIRRTWKPGDEVHLELPMAWRWIKGRQAQAGRAALMRGPVVFCLNPARHPDLAGANLRKLALIPDSIEGPFPDETVRPGGLKARVAGWKPGVHANIGVAKPNLVVELTEFPDAGGEATYFCVANPADPRLEDDELFGA